MKGSDPKTNKAKQKTLPERLRESSFPPAAVLGAFTSFVTTASGRKSEAHPTSLPESTLVQISFDSSKGMLAAAPMEVEYSLNNTIGDATSKYRFFHSLSGIATNSVDYLYVLADGEMKIFSPSLDLLQSWKAPEGSQCLAVGSGGKIYFGAAGRIEICGDSGARLHGFAAGGSGKPAIITAIKIFKNEILAADAAARLIHRFDINGKQAGSIGTQGKSSGFMLPNRSLDFDVNTDGVIYAADSGRHRVSSWDRTGTPISHFGKFGQANPQDFVGCCNPVNLAIGPDGNIVTAEKVIPRVKVYDPTGKILALIGPENFDPKCTHLYLAVDSRGRILAADPVRLQVRIFSPMPRAGGSKNV